jgi:hypothetical protein
MNYQKSSSNRGGNRPSSSQQLIGGTTATASGLNAIPYSSYSSSSSSSMNRLPQDSSDLKKYLGHTGSISSHSSLPGQKPIITTAGYIGSYSPDQRKVRIERFLEKRGRRVWTRKVKYDVRKNFADSRLRIKVNLFRFVFLFRV